jgi:hypothetical protein
MCSNATQSKPSLFNIVVLQEKAAEAAKQEEEKREKPEPEEQEGMPQHQHCPPFPAKPSLVRLKPNLWYLYCL